MFLKRFSLPIIFTLSFFTFSISACKDDKNIVTQTEITFKKEGELKITKTDSTTVTIDIEIANTEFETQTGLMYRDVMAKNQGMLFIFDDETERFFYMKNTKIPLDIIYINANKTIVSFQKNAKPMDETSLPSNLPAKYVLEVNAGLVDTWGISVGNTINYNE